eukprot:TRINITY_DN9299_c0_g2_i1.p1 TRINITY_DN9299_c0_g2~~TRINITY_DN9299_c0_g2_i1.p1  ORF type:complete len:152 (-),score=17.66 TRINITY_DN9299_c0_g2_i1:98-553(-)
MLKSFMMMNSPKFTIMIEISPFSTHEEVIEWGVANQADWRHLQRELSVGERTFGHNFDYNSKELFELLDYNRNWYELNEKNIPAIKDFDDSNKQKGSIVVAHKDLIHLLDQHISEIIQKCRKKFNENFVIIIMFGKTYESSDQQNSAKKEL